MSDFIEILKWTAARACLGNVYIHTQIRSRHVPKLRTDDDGEGLML